MRPLHSRRKRTTQTEAQEYIKNGIGGGMSTSDYLSDEQRKIIATEMRDELFNIVSKRFPKTTNIEYAILKGHTIIEYALTQFIRCSSNVLVEIESIKFQFSQKIEIAILLGLGNGDPTLVTTIELWNKLRNQVAHKFEIDQNILNNILHFNIDKNYLKKLNDRRKVSCLKSICAVVCGQIAGSIKANVLLTNKSNN